MDRENEKWREILYCEKREIESQSRWPRSEGALGPGRWTRWFRMTIAQLFIGVVIRTTCWYLRWKIEITVEKLRLWISSFFKNGIADLWTELHLPSDCSCRWQMRFGIGQMALANFFLRRFRRVDDYDGTDYPTWDLLKVILGERGNDLCQCLRCHYFSDLLEIWFCAIFWILQSLNISIFFKYGIKIFLLIFFKVDGRHWRLGRLMFHPQRLVTLNQWIQISYRGFKINMTSNSIFSVPLINLLDYLKTLIFLSSDVFSLSIYNRCCATLSCST